MAATGRFLPVRILKAGCPLTGRVTRRVLLAPGATADPWMTLFARSRLSYHKYVSSSEGLKAHRFVFDPQFSLRRLSAPKAYGAFYGPVDGHRTNQVGGSLVRPAGPAKNVFLQN